MKQNKIAVTGGIGSGKSTVCKILKGKGFPVFSCDEVYAELLANGSILSELVKAFGTKILDGNGNLDRKKTSQIVFADESKRQLLNKITHTKIFEEIFRRAEGINDIVFFEVPLLFEGNYQGLFDNVIVVLRDKKSRVESLIERDGLTEEDIEKRIQKQYNYDNNDFAEYYVIHNDGNFTDLCDIINDLLLKIA